MTTDIKEMLFIIDAMRETKLLNITILSSSLTVYVLDKMNTEQSIDL